MRRLGLCTGILCVCFSLLGGYTTGFAAVQEQSYPLIIRGGFVIVGDGSKGMKADVAVKGERIIEVAPHIKAKGDVELQAAGLVLAPGFIDMHTHSDGGIFRTPLSDSKIRQGVTTEVINNCGSGDFPIAPAEKNRQKRQATKSGVAALEQNSAGWYSFKEYADALEQYGVGVNIVGLVPHNRLRSSVLGSKSSRHATEAEIAAMKNVLKQAMRDGAWGLSSGLEYMPGSFSSTEELVGLASILPQYDAIYASHIRNEAKDTMKALDEALLIGRESGARVHISHIKASGRTNWGQSKAMLSKMAKAREQGIRVSADQYPYTASSTSLSSQILKPWMRAGGVDKMLQRFKDPETRKKILPEVAELIAEKGGADKIVFVRVAGDGNQNLRGKSLAEVSQMRRVSEAEAALRLLEESKAAAYALYFSMTERDLETFMSDPHISMGSDGSGMKARPGVQAYHHPRSYGTFAKVLGHYVREKRLLSVEKAVYKMSGLPAAQLGLADRGQIKPGYFADMVLFDLQKVNGPADFLQPNRYAEGIPYVMVNGRWAVEDGVLTGITAGKVLRKGIN